MAAVEKILSTADGKIAARVWNSGAPEKVLALHGWLDNAASFDALAPYLPADWEITALDLPGHGFSYHREDDHGYPFTDWITVLMDVVDHLGWDKFTFLGHSMGGGVAALYSAVFPEKVKRLVLVESLGPVALPAESAPERLAKFLKEVRRHRANKTPIYTSMDEVVRLRRMATAMTDASARLVLQRSLKPCKDGLTWRSDPTLLLPSPVRMVPEQIHAFLREIKAPTIVIRATSGLQYDPADTAERIKSLAHAKIVQVTGGHHVHLDDPQTVAKAITKELA